MNLLLDYKRILDAIPAVVYINQLDDFDDPTTGKNIYVNKQGLDFLEMTQERIIEMGFRFFIETMHPEDLKAIVPESMIKNPQMLGRRFGGMMRIRKIGGDFKWFYGWSTVIELKNGKPWQFLNITIDVEPQVDTPIQLLELLKDNNRLRNELKIAHLTPRERVILKHIANGSGDPEIAEKLFISIKTAKTHRHNILVKLNLKKSTDLVRFAVENGLN